MQPNGSEKIGGAGNGDLTIRCTNGQGITLVYVDATEGWRFLFKMNQCFDAGVKVPAFIAATGGTITTLWKL